MAKGGNHRSGRRSVSPITLRILAVNLLALGILVAGLLYVGEYRRRLIAAELSALDVQAGMFAAALGEGAVGAVSPLHDQLLEEIAHQMVRRMVETTGTRARLFGLDGGLIADSRLLLGPGGMIQIEELPPPSAVGGVLGTVLEAYDGLVARLPGRDRLPPYRESAVQRAEDYGEVMGALAGEDGREVRGAGAGMMLSVAVPVQRYKQVLGALMLSRDSRGIDAALLEVRIDILKVFAAALAVTVGLSLYLAGTIARPIRLLADAAERARHGHHRHHTIPDLSGRGDEIGDLAETLGEMTEALWRRMDAIESFAADVAHEIKNPLSSLHSAVETAARIEDPDQQRQLMAIIQEDVLRLDRLISDISDASRLDAELSREDTGPVDLALMLASLVAIHDQTGAGSPIRLELDGEKELVVEGIERRLAQVFRNLIDNAVSFSPPGQPIVIDAGADGGWVEVGIADNGPGIPEGKEEAIFDRFYSERPKAEKFGVHSGLGLSISRQIVEAHGGTIVAENRRHADGHVAGARFTARLPAS